MADGPFAPHRAIGISAALLALHNAQRLTPVPLFDELRVRLATDYVGVGNLFGAYLLTYALSSIPVGMLADRIKSKNLMALGAALSLLASLVFAIASQYLVAIVARCVLGIGGAFLYVPTVRYIVNSFPREKRGSVMGFVQAGAGIGMILPLTLLPFLADVFNVGGAFLMLPVLSAVVLSGVLAGLPSERIPQIRSASMSFRLLAGNRGFWCLVTYFFLGMLAYYAVMAWLPTFLRRDFSYSAVEAGLASTLVSIALVVGSPLAGLLSDSLQTRTPVLLVGSLMSVMAFVLFLFSADPKVVVGAGLLCGISMAFTVPVLIIVVGETFGAGLAGVTVSIAATAGQIASSLSGPLFGYVYQTSTAFAAVWGVALMIAAGSIPFLLLATKIIKQTKREGQKG